MNIEFAWPWFLAALPLPLLALLLPRAASATPAALHFPFYNALQTRLQSHSSQASRPRLILAVLAWLLLVLAATRPQLIGETVHLPVSSRSLMLAVDLSGSMQTKDMQINGRQLSRLTAVKLVAGEFIDKRKGDRIGLILFGDEAYLQVPLTLDRKTVHTLLDEAQIGLAGKQTAIGDAIGLAIKRLHKEPARNRILILLTDGTNTAGNVDPLKAADLAAQEGVRIYTIGIGSGEIEVQTLFGLRRVATNDLDEATLKAIASKTGGRYFRARDTAQLAKIYTLLDRIEPVSKDEQTWRPVDELYFWPLAAAFLLTVLIALLAAFGQRATSTPAEVRHA
ncbi:Aerotolerance protein BatA [hydrothermal vent metagenome]|uniref:Aerotolerance protein BatA n=1 Tax=hydrothermal vent metagenome TaxID=652676 RepID=A0A3B1C245_9ZZZZ